MATEPIMVQGNESTTPIAPSILTVRMIMQGKEVGSIIGKKGDNIKKYREDSGAKINISDGSCPERIVTITGTTENIHKAFTMICSKFEEDLQNTPTVPKPPVTLRLVVPASQCGSLIGKGGIKIKEIREGTGASIQVASEMLPNSTERAVTISGTAEAVTACIRLVCGIMLESPPKGATIPYRPKPAVPPIVYAGGQAFVMQNPQVGVHPPQAELNKLNQMSIGQPVPILPPTAYLPGNRFDSYKMGRLPSNPDMGGFDINGSYNQYASMYLSAAPGYAPVPFPQRPSNNGPIPHNVPQTHEMNIPNDLIGCIIGRGGQKINEIRQISGANIKISNAEEGNPDRKVTITGTPETIGMAQYLINTSMELHKTLVLDPNSAATSPNGSSTPTSATPVTSVATPPTIQSQPAPLTMPMSIPAMKHYQVIGMNGVGGFNGINGLNAGISANSFSNSGLTAMNGLNPGLQSFNGYSVIDPSMFLTNGYGQALSPQQAGNFTGKVRVGMAAVKTASPKFAPY